MTSRIEILEMQNVKLKEDNRKLTKHFGQKKAENQMVTSLLKVDASDKFKLNSIAIVCSYIAYSFNFKKPKGLYLIKMANLLLTVPLHTLSWNNKFLVVHSFVNHFLNITSNQTHLLIHTPTHMCLTSFY